MTRHRFSASRRRQPRVAALLAAVVLIPTIGMAVLAGSTAATRWSDRRTSSNMQSDAVLLHSFIDARAAVTGEYVQSGALAFGADLGETASQLAKLLDIPFTRNLRQARLILDADRALPSYPALASDLAGLVRLRPKIDAGHATFTAVDLFFTTFSADIDTIWNSRIGHLRGLVEASTPGGGRTGVRLDGLDASFSAFKDAFDRLRYSNNLVSGQNIPTNLQRLIDANGRYSADIASLADRLGPKAEAAWHFLQNDPPTLRFQAVIEKTVTAGLAGTIVSFDNVAAYGRKFVDSLKWIADLTLVVEAASTDLRDIANHERTTASRGFVTGTATAALLAGLTLLAAVLLARALDRPLKRLAEAAHQISQGNFTLPRIRPDGPMELAATIAAINDMTATLAALETYALTLAENPTAPSLDQPLPGPTGQALQTTLDQLRASIRTSQEQRVMLQEVASHDGLTGLLNRTAALDAIGRDLSRSRRHRTRMTVLFIDLDDLKGINDTYSHEVGDNAIILTANALQATTRQSDVVARLGGDEFLVSTIAGENSAEVQALAERIHRAIADQTLAADKAVVALRCSIGIALAEPGDTVESVIHKADQALYRAKQAGRNQICWYTGAGAPATR